MIEVIALVCSMQAPLQCKNVTLTFTADHVTPFECFMYGQAELAKWKGEHPGWEVRRGFKCGVAGRFAKI